MHRTALLLGDLGDQGQPFVGSGVGIGERNAKRAVVNVPVVEMFDEGGLVRWVKLGEMNLIADDDIHGGTRRHLRAFLLTGEDRRSCWPVRWLSWFCART